MQNDLENIEPIVKSSISKMKRSALIAALSAIAIVCFVLAALAINYDGGGASGADELSQTLAQPSSPLKTIIRFAIDNPLAFVFIILLLEIYAYAIIVAIKTSRIKQNDAIETHERLSKLKPLFETPYRRANASRIVVIAFLVLILADAIMDMKGKAFEFLLIFNLLIPFVAIWLLFMPVEYINKARRSYLEAIDAYDSRQNGSNETLPTIYDERKFKDAIRSAETLGAFAAKIADLTIMAILVFMALFALGGGVIADFIYAISFTLLDTRGWALNYAKETITIFTPITLFSIYSLFAGKAAKSAEKTANRIAQKSITIFSLRQAVYIAALITIAAAYFYLKDNPSYNPKTIEEYAFYYSFYFIPMLLPILLTHFAYLKLQKAAKLLTENPIDDN